MSDLTQWQMTGLATIVIGSCLICLWMLFFFSRRLQGVAYLRGYLVESAKKEEFHKLQRDLLEEACNGPLSPLEKDAPPVGFGETSQLWPGGTGAPYTQLLKYNYDDVESPEHKDKRKKMLAACQQWEAEERRRYAARLKNAAELAQKAAEERVPKSLDMSLLGGGWSFLLEFSTLIVIIFSILALGILHVLNGQDIVPILAAIAGYVLGKSGKAPEGAGKSQTDGYQPTLSISAPPTQSAPSPSPTTNTSAPG